MCHNSCKNFPSSISKWLSDEISTPNNLKPFPLPDLLTASLLTDISNYHSLSGAVVHHVASSVGVDQPCLARISTHLLNIVCNCLGSFPNSQQLSANSTRHKFFHPWILQRRRSTIHQCFSCTCLTGSRKTFLQKSHSRHWPHCVTTAWHRCQHAGTSA